MNRKQIVVWSLVVLVGAAFLLHRRFGRALSTGQKAGDGGWNQGSKTNQTQLPNPPTAGIAAGNANGAPSSTGAVSRIAVSKAQYFALLRGMPLPGSDLTDKFNSDDEAQLLEAYRRTSKLTERSGLVWVLAHVGSEETAKAFIFTLTQEFKGAKLVADEGGTRGSEAGVMQTIVDCMGLLATRSDTAWEYVKQGTEPSYWQQSVSWTSSTGGEIYGLLAASAIQSVGMANRPDVRQTIDNLKARPPLDVGVPVSMRRVFDGDVMQAAFYADLREEKGDASFYRRLVDAPRDQFDASGDFGRWVAGKGREWDTWYKARLAAEK